MTDLQPLLILDLEGVILRLRMDGNRASRRVRRLLRSYGFYSDLIPLYDSAKKTIEQAKSKGASVDALATEIWKTITEEESFGAENPLPLPGFDTLREQFPKAKYVLISNYSHTACVQALESVGIDLACFAAIHTREEAEASTLSSKRLLEIKTWVAPEANKAYLISARKNPIVYAQEIVGRELEIITIGVADDREMIAACPDYLVNDLSQVAAICQGENQKDSLSVVLLAYNEEPSIRKAVEETDLFLGRHFLDWEIIVVDDGSRDQTRSIVEEMQQKNPKIRLIHHRQNMGMGASLRDGYIQASKDYVTFLPGDRQVRAASLIAFLPQLASNQVIVSSYITPPSGSWRDFQSKAFRWILKRFLGNIVDFSGGYVIPRHALERAQPATISTNTFVYSFFLLKRLKMNGMGFRRVFIRPYAREHGSSRVSSIGKILTILKELILRKDLRKSF